MDKTTFQITYPSSFSCTNKSEINFYEGTPDIFSLYYSEERSRRCFFITDSTVASLPCMSDFISKFDDGIYKKDNLLILGSGEPYKTIESVLRIVSAAVEADFSRNDIFVGIGGGVITDLTAFAASIFKRGIEVQLIPTTLLAMVDAAMGGKTGCDYENYKNIIGTFYPATKITYFPEFIKTLPENQFYSGLAEAFKTALLFDKELFQLFKTENELIKNRNMELFTKIIQHCVKAKSTVVEQDFTEKNIRTTLNLGHTFAHALETTVGLGAVTHGHAVAWGIGRATELSYKKHFCKEAFKNEVFDILKLYNWETAAIPSIVKGGGVGERFVQVMHKDKKNLSEKIRLVLLKGENEPFVEEINDKDILNVLK